MAYHSTQVISLTSIRLPRGNLDLPIVPDPNVIENGLLGHKHPVTQSHYLKEGFASQYYWHPPRRLNILAAVIQDSTFDYHPITLYINLD